MATYYRAAASQILGIEFGGCCCSASEQTARAYLGGQGLGGPRLYRFEIEGNILDLSRMSAMEAVSAIREIASGIASDTVWPYQALDYDGAWEDVVSSGYDGILYPDEYPAGAITLAWYGEKLLGEEIE